MKFVVAILALLVVQGCLAKPKPRPDAPAAGGDSLQELADNAQKLAKQVSENLGISDVDTTKIGETLKDHSTKLIENLQHFIAKVKEEGKAHEGEVKDTFNKVEAKLSQTAADLNKSLSPDVQAKASELQQTFNKAFKTAADQLNQLVKDPKVQETQDNIQKYSKDFLSQFIELGKQVETKVKSFVEEHEKTHTH